VFIDYLFINIESVYDKLIHLIMNN